MSPPDNLTKPLPHRATALFPVAYLIHLVEEWAGDLPAWTLAALGAEISMDRFILINAIAFPLVVLVATAALLYRKAAWLAISLAALFGANAILHALATLGFGQYSPGAISGLILYLPLSAVVLRSAIGRVPSPLFYRSIALGILVHALVSFVAFQ